MKKIIVVLIILGIGWYGSQKYRSGPSGFSGLTTTSVAGSEPESASNGSRFKCDGRTRCSQMTSCEEAKFFLKNCPDVKMDGNNDGIPCEKQWCR